MSRDTRHRRYGTSAHWLMVCFRLHPYLSPFQRQEGIPAALAAKPAAEGAVGGAATPPTSTSPTSSLCARMHLRPSGNWRVARRAPHPVSREGGPPRSPLRRDEPLQLANWPREPSGSRPDNGQPPHAADCTLKT